MDQVRALLRKPWGLFLVVLATTLVVALILKVPKDKTVTYDCGFDPRTVGTSATFKARIGGRDTVGPGGVITEVGYRKYTLTVEVHRFAGAIETFTAPCEPRESSD